MLVRAFTFSLICIITDMVAATVTVGGGKKNLARFARNYT